MSARVTCHGVLLFCDMCTPVTNPSPRAALHTHTHLKHRAPQPAPAPPNHPHTQFKHKDIVQQLLIFIHPPRQKHPPAPARSIGCLRNSSNRQTAIREARRGRLLILQRVYFDRCPAARRGAHGCRAGRRTTGAAQGHEVRNSEKSVHSEFTAQMYSYIDFLKISA